MKEIFIVEDDHDIRELLEFLLVAEDYKVKSFATAEEFQNGIAHHLPDLILLDIMLPDGNGIEMCKGLSTDSGTKDIPVFLMSAHANIRLNEAGGAKDFIAKPFDVDELLNKISLQLN